ncbi:histidine kinase [Flavobacterium sp. xlx-214]|uniref:histidine kinase n=1 Tax=unclassified Flavobacterium TaxID=196869 RepID=UPI0013D652A2|nr:MULTISPECIES: histidine kinase [unclassified Flavobacterium]MBA5793691.1 histidine kinase [Flavobacterium sp. xlx-221]QMI83285.1 histidine kinase [Flavobacterium sp. xlx-214]
MKEFLRHLKQFSIILIICYILMIGLNYTFSKHFEGFDFLSAFIIVFTYTLSIYVANTFILSDYYLKREKNKRNILMGGFLVNILTLFVVFVINIIGNLIYSDSEIITSFKSSLRTAVFSGWFSMTITTIVYIVLLIRRKDKIEVNQQKTIAVKATTSFESLKNQLDPHFLFNSLNVLSALIEENPAKAQEFTVSLSKVYRYVLDQKDKNLITVEEELNFAKLYVSLLKVRFEDAILVHFSDVSIFTNYKIVPLSLQLLLENAVKHNIISDQKPLKIEIFKEGEFIVVQNSFQKKQTFEKTSGIGLQNIINRYQLVSNEEIEILQTNEFYKVRLPLLLSEVIFEHQEDLITEELFNNAYAKMHQLKEFYITLWSTITGIPLFVIVNIWFFPQYKWSLALSFFMVFALVINSLKTFSFLQKWEQKMIKKQINKK